MPEEHKTDQTSIHTLATNVAVISNEMIHVKEDIAGIRKALEGLSVVSRQDFDAFKKEVERDYVKRSDIKALMRFWDAATSTLGKMIILGLLSAAIYFTVQGTFINIKQ